MSTMWGPNARFRAGSAIPERIRLSLAADVIVTGGYVLAGRDDARTLRVDVRAVEAAGGEESYTVSVSAPPDELLGLVSRLGAAMRDRLGERARSLEIARAIFEFYPDDIDIGLDLALALAGAGQVDEATGTLAALRALPSPVGDDARIDLAEAWMADADLERKGAAADRAAAKAESGGASLLLAYARIQQGEAWRSAGEPDRVAAAISDAVGIRRAAGDRWGVALDAAELADDRERDGQPTLATVHARTHAAGLERLAHRAAAAAAAAASAPVREAP